MWIETSGAPEGYELTGMKPIKMERKKFDKDWLGNKYGEQVQLWEA
jgi:hypothetical protein